MAGNVGEWTSTPHGDQHVLKGSEWSEWRPDHIRSVNRYEAASTVRGAYLGFRCAGGP